MNAFIVEFDRRTGAVAVSEFTDHGSAVLALHRKEAAKGSDSEVVLLFADNEAELALTHPRYFESARELADLASAR